MEIIAAIITDNQAKELVGNWYAPDSYFAPFKDVDDQWCISVEEVEQCVNPDLKWVCELKMSEVVKPD